MANLVNITQDNFDVWVVTTIYLHGVTINQLAFQLWGHHISGIPQLSQVIKGILRNPEHPHSFAKLAPNHQATSEIGFLRILVSVISAFSVFL